jgi:hypothetical protein
MGDDHAGEPKKKGAGSKLLSCCCLFFVVMMLIGAAVGVTIVRNVSDDPAVAAARLPSFVDATVPPGYAAVAVARVPFYAGAIVIGRPGLKAHEFDPGKERLLIVVVDPPSDHRFQAPQDVVKQLKDVPGGGDKLKPEAEPGDQPLPVRKVKVRGEEVEVVEQLVPGATPTRRLLALIPRAKGDPHLLGVVGWGKADGFDQAAFDAFLESIQ